MSGPYFHMPAAKRGQTEMGNNRTKRIFFATGAAIVAGFVAPNLAAAAASSAAETTAPAAQNDSVPSLGEVVVTSRKRPETVLAAPVAITAQDSAALQSKGITDYSTLEKFTPGFHYQDYPDRSTFTFTMRGLFPASNLSERSAAQAFIDGVPTAAGAVPGFSDLDRVEVVNGPQSAYFGRATFAGAVNFITRIPGFTPHAGFTAEYASFGTYEFAGNVEGSVIPDVLALRLGVRDYHTDGAFQNYGFGGRLGSQNTQSISMAYNFVPTSKLTIHGFITGWQDDDGPYARETLLESSYNCNPKVAGGPPSYTCGGISSIPNSGLTYDNSDGSRISAIDHFIDPKLDFVHHFGFHRNAVQSTTSVAYELPEGFVLAANIGFGDQQYMNVLDQADRYPAVSGKYYDAATSYDTRDFTQEIRLTTPKDWPIKAMIGFTNSHRTDQTITTFDVSGTLLSVLTPTVFGYDNQGVFGSATYDITSKLSISAEGRYQNDNIHQHVLGGGLNLSADTKSFTPRVILQYKFNPTIQAYASYAEGTRPAQLNTTLYSATAAQQAQVQAQVSVPIVVPEERLKMEEVGLKGSFFDSRLHLLSAFYYGDWTNRQVTQPIQILLPVVTNYTVVLPGGKVELYGVELQGEFKATQNFTLQSNFAYNETKIQKTVCVECQVITGNLNPTGTRIPQYPAFTGAVSGIYDYPISNELTGFGRLDYTYTGKQYDTESNVAWINAFSLVNLHLGVRRGNSSIEAFVNNLLDTNAPAGITRGTDVFAATNYALVLIPNQPRVVGVRLSAKY